MWRTLSKLLLCFLLASFVASSYAEDRKIWIYESELQELKQISTDLENRNQTLESELKITLDKSKKWEQAYTDLTKSWETFKLEMAAELTKKDKQIRTRDTIIWILAVAVPIGFIGGAIVF